MPWMGADIKKFLYFYMKLGINPGTMKALELSDIFSWGSSKDNDA